MSKAAAVEKKVVSEPVQTGGGEGQAPVLTVAIAHGDAERVQRILHELSQLTDRGSLGAVVQAAIGRYRRSAL